MSQYEISYKQLTGEEPIKNEYDIDEDILLDLQYQNKIIELLHPARGDIVHLEECGEYRNSGKAIWDGSKLISLHYDIDDYGSVPPEFTVGDEFKADHWLEVVDHNEIVWVDVSKYREELLNNLSPLGTFFETDLGKFTIRVSTHSLYMAREALKKHIIEAKGPVVFDAIDTHTLQFSFDQHDELQMLYPDCTITGHGSSQANFTIIIPRNACCNDSDTSIYMLSDYGQLTVSTPEEYRHLMNVRPQ